MSYKQEFASNNADLQTILDMVNALPEAGADTDVEDAIVSGTLTEYSNDRVIGIRGYAFACCDSLKAINFAAVESVGVSAFEGCKNLTSVELPAVEVVNSYAFRSCASLKSVSLPSALDIGRGAFQYCESLNSVGLPAARSVDIFAFHGCKNLTGLDLPEAQNIGISAFATCHALSYVNLPVALVLSDYAFAGCRSLTSINMPAATSIGSYAFNPCISLSRVDLPAATSIGNNAFRGCSMLVSLYLVGSSLCKLGGSAAFSSTPIGGYSASAGQYGSIYVPASLLASYKAASNWSYFSSRFVAIPTFGMYLANTGSLIGTYNTIYGMTWSEWVNSNMNTAGCRIVNDTYIENPNYSGVYLYNYDGTVVNANAAILTDGSEADRQYYIGEPEVDPF